MKNLTTSTIMMLIASSLIFFCIGRYSANMSNSSDVASTTNMDKTTEKGVDTKKDDVVAVNAAATKAAEEKAAAAAAEKAKAEEAAAAAAAEKNKVEPAVPIAAPNSLVTSTSLNRPKMGISDKKIGEVLTSIAKNLEAQRIPYNSENPKLMQDCSGIFHRLKDSLQIRLPALRKQGGEYQYPPVKSVRSSRQIADWYYKNKNFLIVQDAMVSRNSIRPGAVMFYAKPNKTYKDITIEKLTDRDNNYTRNGAIMHIAVVTEIKTDKEGNVIEYTIMHARSEGAKRSNFHKEVQSTNTVGLPPFGNWSQQWVGIANMATPSK